ncbi:TonB-dependent receptor [Epilithonimonas sp.]|uniref:TonB-dependent receptor n=1 Tax=Epilithonimonas sp. TaxID=2894511 RepID=UPI0028A0AA5B|nr:TonB-dependent receptor [Epilithonimonas sp.]
MRKLLPLFILICLKINAQTYSINGKVTDQDNNPIENATVSLIKQKDSSIINFTGTNKKGNFEIKIPEQKEISFLQISGDKFRSSSKKFEVINKDEDLGTVKLEKDLITNIEEVQITASPVKIKKDTVEYNASYLKVKPDGKIDDLLKEIPGVETDEDGKITVNGKPINKILINGKPFFDKDGKIALQTFPADIIKKIQITTSKTKEEQFTGRTPKSDSLTINFNIDEKNNKGNLNNLMLGYGTNKRYEGTMFLTRFQKQRNIALIGASNNINTTGFSVDSFFDSGTRSKNSAVNGRPVSSGILRTSMVGVNYSDKIGESLDLEKFSLQYNDSNQETYSKTDRTTFLPDYKLDKNSERSGNMDTRKFNFNTDANYMINGSSNIIFSTDFTNTSIDRTNDSKSFTFKDDAQLNSNINTSRGNSNNNNFTPKIGYTKKFQKPGRSLSASVSNVFSENKSSNYSILETIFYQSPEDNDYRNQLSQTKSSRNNFSADFKYDEPISDSATVSISVNYNNENLGSEKTVNDLDVNTNQYSIYNSLLSNTLNQNNNYIRSQVGYNLNKEKFTFQAGANLNITKLDVNSIFNLQNYNFQRNFVLPEYDLTFQYKFSRTKNLRITNGSNYTIPQAMELNPFRDESNPLMTLQGNLELKSSWQNSTNINFTSSDFARGINFYARFGFSYLDNDIVDYSYFDETGRQFSSYVNVSGNKRLILSSSFTKNYKWNGNQIKLTPSFSSNYSYRKGFVDGSEFTNDIYNITPRFNLGLNLKDRMDLRASYSYGFSQSHYTNYRLDKTKTTNQNLTIGVTNYFLAKTFFIDNDFRFNGNNNLSADFNRKSYFWNASVNYQFYKKQMLLKFRVYDLLNQRQNAVTNIGDNYIEDREDLVLRRYFMLSLIMKFNKIGGNKS